MILLTETANLYIAPKKDGTFVVLDALPKTVAVEVRQLTVEEVFQFSAYIEEMKNLGDGLAGVETQEKAKEILESVEALKSLIIAWMKDKIVSYHNTKGKKIVFLDAQILEMANKQFEASFLTEEDLDFLD